MYDLQCKTKENEGREKRRQKTIKQCFSNYDELLQVKNFKIILTDLFLTYFKCSPVRVYHNHSPLHVYPISRKSFSAGCGISRI